MSQEFFDPELFADFIAEAKEHLETIEPNLLELEKAPDNLALLNDIFRPMHSLKGASGFLGLNRINQLAHKSENILDELRKGTMVVTSEIMDVILASYQDALRQMIDNLESTNAEGDAEIGHIMAQIDAIMAGETAPQPVAAEPEAAPQPEEIVEPASVVEEPATSDEQPTADEAAETYSENSDDDATDTPRRYRWHPTKSLRPCLARISGADPARSAHVYPHRSLGEGHLKDFIDESNDTIENLTSSLAGPEENPVGRDELVNDIFRFFHNMKGNSGIIGYSELNSLTHEAETLLNNVRQGKITPTHELIDLLLLVVDVLEALVQRINIEAGSATPFNISPVVKQLQGSPGQAAPFPCRRNFLMPRLTRTATASITKLPGARKTQSRSPASRKLPPQNPTLRLKWSHRHFLPLALKTMIPRPFASRCARQFEIIQRRAGNSQERRQP